MSAVCFLRAPHPTLLCSPREVAYAVDIGQPHLQGGAARVWPQPWAENSALQAPETAPTEPEWPPRCDSLASLALVLVAHPAHTGQQSEQPSLLEPLRVGPARCPGTPVLHCRVPTPAPAAPSLPHRPCVPTLLLTLPHSTLLWAADRTLSRRNLAPRAAGRDSDTSCSYRVPGRTAPPARLPAGTGSPSCQERSRPHENTTRLGRSLDNSTASQP